MARARPGLLHVGIKGHVLALDRATGTEVWRTRLQGTGVAVHDFVHLHRDHGSLYASYNGHVFCLDPATGAVLWHNGLKGLGRGVTSMLSDVAPPSDGTPASLLEHQRRLRSAHHSGGA